MSYNYQASYSYSTPSSYSPSSYSSSSSPISPSAYSSQPMSYSHSGSSYTSSSSYEYPASPEQYQQPSQAYPDYTCDYTTPSYQPLTSYTSPTSSRGQSSTSSSSKGQYLCLHRPCADTCIGFARLADLQRHDKVIHNRDTLDLVSCTQPGCKRVGENGFTRTDKMKDHLREVHKVEPTSSSKRQSSSLAGKRALSGR